MLYFRNGGFIAWNEKIFKDKRTGGGGEKGDTAVRANSVPFTFGYSVTARFLFAPPRQAAN
jgi:hypothetical protein